MLTYIHDYVIISPVHLQVITAPCTTRFCEPRIPIGLLPKAGMMDTTDNVTGTDGLDIEPQFSDETLETARRELRDIHRQLETAHPLVESENFSSDGVQMIGTTKFQLVNGDGGAITLSVSDGDKQIGEYPFDSQTGLLLDDFFALVDTLRQEQASAPDASE